MSVSPVRIARAPLALFGIAALAAALGGCAPERVDMNVHDIFTGDAARYALQTQMPPTVLAAVGGFLPAAVWPSDAPPLLLDVKVVAENKIDLAGSNIDVTPYSALRLHWTTLLASAINASLTPRPTSVEIYVGPSTATSLTDPGVLPLASGAFPESLSNCDGGSCSAVDAGPGDFDAGLGDFDAGPGDLDGGTSDAGTSTSADAGVVTGSSAVPGQTLVFASDAQLTLQKIVFAAQPFALFVVLHMPVDTASDPRLPVGGADLTFDIQFEMAR